MTHDQDLFGKTFDQQLDVTKGKVDDRDISPNRRIHGEIIFEPMGSGVRVTARDAEHRVLWGYVGSKETIRQIHCLVATYDTLQNLIAEELEKRGLQTTDDPDPLASAHNSLDELEATVKWLRGGLEVKKVSDATLDRAKLISRIASDANRQITLETNTLKGMRTKTEHAPPEDAR